MGLIIGGVSASDLIMDGQSVSLYIGGSPPVKVWPTRETVQITLDTAFQARNQLRAALADRGLDYKTVEELPFDIELVGTGSTLGMFAGCSALTSVPPMDTSQVTDMMGMFLNCTSITSVPAMDTRRVTNMSGMFEACSSLTYVPDMDASQVEDMSGMFFGCSSLTHAPAMHTGSVTRMSSMFQGCSSLAYVPDMDTSSVTDMSFMFSYCSSLTDGNVLLIGRHPQVNTGYMIYNSGLTREPWYTADGVPIDVYEVSLTDVRGSGTVHPLVSVTVPAGETWRVRVQGTMTRAHSTTSSRPQVRIGGATFGPYAQGEAVDCSGTVTSADTTIGIRTQSGTSSRAASFVGTVTIEQVVQITPGFGSAARDQFHAALTNRGLDYQTVKGIPFGIEVVGSGSMAQMFFGCASLISAPALDTSQVTDMYGMFFGCSSLAYVPDMHTGQVTDMASMFRNCSSLTDGNVRLIGRNPNVYTASMITGSGMTRFPFYDTAGNPI